MKKQDGAARRPSFMEVRVVFALEGVDLLRLEEEELLCHLAASALANGLPDPGTLQSMGVNQMLVAVTLDAPQRPQAGKVVLAYQGERWEPAPPDQEESLERVDDPGRAGPAAG